MSNGIKWEEQYCRQKGLVSGQIGNRFIIFEIALERFLKDKR